jgi:hypothetical protein
VTDFIFYEVSPDFVEDCVEQVHPKQVGFVTVVLEDGAELDYPVLLNEALNRFMAVVPVEEVKVFNEAFGPK